MKKIIIITILLITSLDFLYSQRIDTTYYNKKDQRVSRKKYCYYRVASQDSDRVKVFDYFKSGSIKMSGAYTSFDFSKEIGPFCYYSKNAIKQIEVHQPSLYPEIYNKFKNYIDKIPKQPDSLKLIITFYKNNSIYGIGYASECCFWYGPWYYFTKKGEPMIMYTYQFNNLDGPFVWFINYKPIIKGEYKNNKKDGKWLYYDNKEKIIKILIYKDGKVVERYYVS
ncbi:MAG: hypothetical protein ABSG89_09070 [Bacteroidales bacterium]|jgi:antitoxin component YwqK of YwqJK toxin-antitoxin module